MDKLQTFKQFALNIAMLSHCKRAQVGCIIFDKKFQYVYAIGYNGPPVGISNDACIDVAGLCGCAHAEMNAVIKAGRIVDACLMTTTTPCILCANAIINHQGITRVYWMKDYRDNYGYARLNDAKIELIFI